MKTFEQRDLESAMLLFATAVSVQAEVTQMLEANNQARAEGRMAPYSENAFTSARVPLARMISEMRGGV